MAEGAGKRKSTKFKPLTDMQERYCQEYVKTPDAQGQAAKRAGFSKYDNAAMRMMKDDRMRSTRFRGVSPVPSWKIQRGRATGRRKRSTR